MTAPAGVNVHPIAGEWGAADLLRLDDEMNRIPGAKRLFVQWVPHAYGRRSMNLAFCRWVRRRVRAGDRLDLMVHERGLGFGEGGVRHNVVAVVHRVMAVLLVAKARKVWTAIPAWADDLRRWTRGRQVSFCWLPIPASIPVSAHPEAVAERRAEILRGSRGVILGHFSTYPPAVRHVLRTVLPGLIGGDPDLHVQLLGRGSDCVKAEVGPILGAGATRLHARADADAATLSCDLQACDLMLQPYDDGASTRRTTLMTSLAHGLPVVTTVGRLSETFWADSDAIVAVRTGDLDGLRREVGTVAVDSEKRRRLGTAARALYDGRFSLAHVIDALRRDECTAC